MHRHSERAADFFRSRSWHHPADVHRRHRWLIYALPHCSGNLECSAVSSTARRCCGREQGRLPLRSVGWYFWSSSEQIAETALKSPPESCSQRGVPRTYPAFPRSIIVVVPGVKQFPPNGHLIPLIHIVTGTAPRLAESIR